MATKSDRARALQMIESGQLTHRQIARELKVSNRTVSRWAQEHRDAKDAAAAPKNPNAAPAPYARNYRW